MMHDFAMVWAQDSGRSVEDVIRRLRENPGAAGLMSELLETGWGLLSYGGTLHESPSDGEGASAAALKGHIYCGADRTSGADLRHLAEEYAKSGALRFDRIDWIGSFAIVDPVHRRWICARDRIGQVDLVWARHDGLTMVATRPSLLLRAGVVSPAVNEAALPEYFVYGHVAGEQTLFAGIDRVPPGCALTGGIQSPRQRRYWTVPFGVDAYANDSEIVARVEAKLREVVQSQIDGASSIVNTLSGGVDSSIVQSVCQEVVGQPVRSCSFGSTEAEYDDTPYATSAARRIGALHTAYRIAPSDYSAFLPAAIRAHEYPLHLEQSVSIYWLLAQLGQGDGGADVVLSGFAADLDFGESLRKYRLAQTLNERVGPWTCGLWRLGVLIPSERVGYYAHVIPSIQSLIRGHSSIRDIFGNLDPVVALDDIELVFGRLDRERLLGFRLGLLDQHASAQGIYDELFLLSMVAVGAAISSWGSMAEAQGREFRYPFADPEFMTMAARIPIGRKLGLGGLLEKPIMKKLAVKRLGPDIAYRRKRTGQLGVARWDSQPELLGKYVRAVHNYDYFDVSVLRRLASRGGKHDNQLLRNLVNFDLWHKMFIEGRWVEEIVLERASACPSSRRRRPVQSTDSVLDEATQSDAVADTESSAALSVLILAARPHLRGPIPKILPYQVAMLESQGYSVEVAYWGSRCDEETMLHKFFGGTLDLAKALRALKAGSHAVLFVNTAHGLMSFLRDIPLLFLTRRQSVRRILLLHGSQVDRLSHPGNHALKLASRFIARSADGLLVLSTAENASWRSFEPRGHYATVLNPFVPGPNLTAAAAEHDLAANMNREERSIIFVGRLMREKGAADLLDAVRRVNNVLPCRLILAGTGPLADQLMAQTRAWGLGNRVDFRGYLDTDSLAHAYASAELLVLPTYWDEGFPTVIAEAMSVGLPVITTRTRGSADLLLEGENCLFVPPRDPAQLAARILTLLTDTQLAQRMSSANRARIASFRPEVVGSAYSRAFELSVGVSWSS